ncbi:sensor domain-containing diguanylate cyclase [Vibrio sp. ZSDE26]|uniref:diguanylate cyclase n=1 Tax=Vibrio amylolyticus TaxID=2847292 RepID=A0A9X2BJM5_9VIBR|nr:sensor domain-containing diguanylate cyclase [Vibrio amylolyticus]MCK6263572.1 sensor domain-containing diguanylate cyclase [Vibrio amylolyticus]
MKLNHGRQLSFRVGIGFTLAIILIIVMIYTAPINAGSESVLRVANSKAWKPYSFINNSGEPEGILIDFWNEYAELNDVEVEFVLVDWNDSLEAIKDGRADVHGGLLWSEPREEFLDFAEPLFEIETQLYYHQKDVGNDISPLLNGEVADAIGAVKGGYEEYFARKEFPKANILVYSTTKELLIAANSGRVTAFVSDLLTSNFYLYSSKEPLSFVPVQYLYSGDLYPAVKKGNESLRNQVISGFTNLTDENRKGILQKWMYIETVYPTQTLWLVVVVVTAMILFFIAIFRRHMISRTKHLEDTNQRLMKLSLTDVLTGISNRRHFTDYIESLEKDGHTISVMIFDIDNFKNVNDTYGHTIGDEVIRFVAQVVKTELNSTMHFSRIGGEEFAIVALDLDFEAAKDLAQRVCRKVHQGNRSEGYLNQLSISVGCAFYEECSGNIDIVKADHLMYRAKKQGKNRVVVEKV